MRAMNVPVRQQRPQITDPLASFIARAKAKASAWKAGEISLHDAVDGLQQAAEAFGLVIELGQDAVQAIMVEAFAPLRDDLPRDDYDGSTFAAACDAADEKQRRKAEDPHLEKLRRLLDDDVSIESAWHQVSRPLGVPIATLWTAEYLLQLGDLERFAKWFDRHSAQERAAILQHLEKRKGRRGT
jgi:hypothetical protein